MKLTDSEIKAAKPREKQFTLSDGDGLQLLIKPNGSKLWQLRYKFAGKEKTASFGKYPTITLKMARDKREEANRQRSNGIDPMEAKKKKAIEERLSQSNSFKAISEDLIKSKLNRIPPIRQRTEKKQRFYAAKLYPKLGNRIITDITDADVRQILKDLQKNMPEGEIFKSGSRIGGFAREVFDHAIEEGYCKINPITKKTTASTSSTKPQPAIVDGKKFAALIQDIYHNFKGGILVREAMKFMAHTFLRTWEMRTLEWEDIDFENKILTIKLVNDKNGNKPNRKNHKVPLSSQVVEILEGMKKRTGKLKYVFHSTASSVGMLSENTINQALRRMGYDKNTMTGHGFRTSASSLMNESGLWQADAIERALSHSEKDAVRKAYNRTSHWGQITEIMQWWSSEIENASMGYGFFAMDEKQRKEVRRFMVARIG